MRQPAGVAAGDVLVAGVAVRVAGRRRITPPPGWSLVRSDRRTRRHRLTQAVYLKVVRAGEPATYTWSFASRTAAAGGVLVYRGVNTTRPLDAHRGRRGMAAPSLRTSMANVLVVDFFGMPGPMRAAVARGTTKRFEAAGEVSTAAADYVKVRPGATGAMVAKATPMARSRNRRLGAARSSGGIGQQVALRPAGAGLAVLPQLDVIPPLPDLLAPDTTLTAGPSGTTNSTSASFSFTSTEAGSGFECRLDSGTWTACTSPKGYSGLAGGAHTFQVRAIDAAGNVDASPASRTWTVDTGSSPDPPPPETTITSGPSGAVNTASASFGFSSSESGSTFQCRLDGGSWGSCTSPKAYSGLTDASHTFNVRAIGPAGDTDASPASRTWTVDTVAPDTTITSGPSGTTTSRSASFGFSSSQAGSSFQCRLDSGGWSACTSPRSYSGLVDGSHTFEVRASDPASNTDASPASRTWTVAGAPPPPGGVNLPAPLAESAGAVFHVATDGSDSNPGTAAQPWATVQKALDTLEPGQRAQVHAGTYTQALDLTRACTASAPCTVEGAPGEARPVLRITNDHVLRAETSAAYWRFRGFTFRDSNITSGGLVDLYGRNLEFSSNELTNSGDQDFYLDEASRDIQILGNWMHHSGLGRTHQSHGAYLQGNDHLVANNLIHDHPYGFGIQVYDKGLRSIVVNNTITHNAHSGIVVGGGGGVSGVIVRNNILAFNSHHGLAWDGTCPNSSAGTTYGDHNVIYGNGWEAIDPQSCSATSTAGGNRFADPLFLDAAARNLHLRSDSPAFGYALADWAPATDREGVDRPRGSGADAGAYEDE